MDPFAHVRLAIQSHTNHDILDAAARDVPIIGYFCTYTPVEVLLSAGAVPLRLRPAGSEDSSLGDAYLSGRLCTLVRHVVSLSLDGHYDFLSGVVCLNTCDHVRRAADVLQKKSGIPFHAFLSVPRSPREDLFPYYLREVRRLRHALCDHLGVAPNDDDLRTSIRRMNAVRERLQTMQSLRTSDPPGLSGEEALALHVASQVLSPETFLALSGDALRGVSSRRPLDTPRARVLLIGAELDDPRYVATIESAGAGVVADELCFGSRSVLDPIDPDCPDPLDAIARAYFFRRSCARMIGDFPRRWATIREHVQRDRIDGAIFQRLLFCDPWGADQHNVMLRSKGEIPVLFLTREYGVVPTGQLRTRVQAFVERIESSARRPAMRGVA